MNVVTVPFPSARSATSAVRCFHYLMGDVRIAAMCALVAIVSVTDPSHADETKSPAEPPVVNVIAPLGVVPGRRAELTVRGQRLDAAKALTVKDAAGAEVAIKSRGRSNPPGAQDAKRVGDTQVVVELTLPESFASDSVTLIIETDRGGVASCRLPVVAAAQHLAEKEPNDGFRQAQPIDADRVVLGQIRQQRDVDVYRISSNASQTWSFNIVAQREGSAMDPILTLYGADGRMIDTVDDIEGTRDAQLSVTFPHAGDYYIVVMDAHDQGGPAHPYRLHVETRGER